MPEHLTKKTAFAFLSFALAHGFSLGQTQPSLIWKKSAGGVVFSSPAVDGSGIVYVGSNDNSLHAFNTDGSTKWTYSTDNWVDSTPALSEDGVIYFGSWDNKLHAVNSSNGARVWVYETNSHVTSSPVLGSNGLGVMVIQVFLT